MLELIELKNTLFNFFMPRRGPPPALTPPHCPPNFPHGGMEGGMGAQWEIAKGGGPKPTIY